MTLTLFRQGLATLAGFCLALAPSISAQPALAQISRAGSTTADTGTADEGVRAGIAAANERDVAGRAFGGFLGGLPVGLSTLTLVRGVSIGVVAAGVGLGIVETSWRVGTTAPSLTPALLNSGEAFRRSYEKSYRERLLERRKTAARLGGLAGGVAGVGLFFLLLSQVKT